LDDKVDPAWKVVSQTMPSKDPDGMWSEKQKAELRKVYQQICDKFKVKPVWGPEKVPWILGAMDEDMPKDWTWRRLFVFCRTRLLRMRKVCNKKWTGKCSFPLNPTINH